MPPLGGEVGRLARTSGWFAPPARDAPPTLVLMCGGKLFVPEAQYRTVFLPAYARDVARGVRHYVIERATTTAVKWYADIDHLGSQALSAEDVLRIASAVARNLKELRPPGSPLLVLLATNDRGVGTTTTSGEVKTGIHLVAPNMEVSTTEARALRDALVERLTTCLPNTSPHGWDTTLDAAVYDNGSLRLVGSRKMEACRPCAGPRCAACHGVGRRDVGRAYELVHVVDASGERDAEWETALRNNTALLALKASIRCPSRGPPPQAAAARKRPRRVAAAPPSSAPSSGVFLRDLYHSPLDCAVEHRDLVVAQVTHAKGDERFLRVQGSGERWCRNVSREHRSSRVYYVATCAGLRARCFCKKTCSQFHGARAPLSSLGRRYLDLQHENGVPIAFSVGRGL